VHVNHLNRAVKATTAKTTSEIISERILQEAKILLKQSEWSISEISFSLGIFVAYCLTFVILSVLVPRTLLKLKNISL